VRTGTTVGRGRAPRSSSDSSPRSRLGPPPVSRLARRFLGPSDLAEGPRSQFDRKPCHIIEAGPIQVPMSGPAERTQELFGRPCQTNPRTSRAALPNEPKSGPGGRAERTQAPRARRISPILSTLGQSQPPATDPTRTNPSRPNGCHAAPSRERRTQAMPGPALARPVPSRPVPSRPVPSRPGHIHPEGPAVSRLSG